MHPQHTPEIRDATGFASLEILDGRARSVANRQLGSLEKYIGREDGARLPEHRDIPLHGYSVHLGNEQVALSIDTNAQGEAMGEDRVFVDARNSLAVLRSRERSRGSRFWNLAFRRGRGDGYGHGWEIDRAEDVYHEQLGNFIARKVTAHVANNPAHNNEANVTEIVARAVVQDQQQMSALERMAAERKSKGSGLFNSLRKSKGLRIAVGIGLGVGAAVAGASGLWTVAVPLMGARAALSASGGYMLGRTGWDAFQGLRTRSLPNDDIRMASSDTHDISGRLLSPEGAFHRFVNILGAEARVGSRKRERQQLIHRMNNLDLVSQFYTVNPAGGPVNANRLDFSSGYTEADISTRLGLLFTNIIRPRQNERLASDQTQSRRRHIAGLVGATVFAGLTLSSAIEVLNVGISSHGHLSSSMSSGHPGGGSTGQHTGSGSTGHNGGGSNGHKGGVSKGKTPGKGNGSSSPSSNGQAAGGSSLKVPDGDTVVILPPHSSISITEVSQTNSDVAVNGAPTGVLHVQPGGGFISTFESQYGLNPQQAVTTYDDMSGQLHGMAGTYLYGSDIRISAPGNLKLSEGARAILDQQLKAYGKLRGISAKVIEKTAGNGTTSIIITTSAPVHNIGTVNHPVIEITTDSVTRSGLNGGGNVVLDGVKTNTEQALVGGHYVSETNPIVLDVSESSTTSTLASHITTLQQVPEAQAKVVTQLAGLPNQSVHSHAGEVINAGALHHQWLMDQQRLHDLIQDDDELLVAA